MVRRGSALGATLLLLACEQPSTLALGDAATKAPESPGPAAIIVSVPAKRALADGEAWLVDDGVSPLGTEVRKPSLAMIVHFVDDSRPILYNRLHRLTYHGRTAKFGEAFPVDAEDLVELGLEAPAEAVWTIGPLGPCSATVGQPYVGRPSADVRVFEVSYALEGCGTQGRWAPVASTTTAMPKGVTWRDAEVSQDASFALSDPEAPRDDAREEPGGWDHPLAAFAEVPESRGATGYVAHGRWAGSEPRIAQALVTALEPAETGACPLESHRATLGWWGEDSFEPITLEGLDPLDPPLLVGAIAWGPETVALVLDDGLDGLLAIAPAEDEAEGPADWVVMPLIAGLWSDADRARAALRVQPCR